MMVFVTITFLFCSLFSLETNKKKDGNLSISCDLTDETIETIYFDTNLNVNTNINGKKSTEKISQTVKNIISERKLYFNLKIIYSPIIDSKKIDLFSLKFEIESMHVDTDELFETFSIKYTSNEENKTISLKNLDSNDYGECTIKYKADDRNLFLASKTNINKILIFNSNTHNAPFNYNLFNSSTSNVEISTENFTSIENLKSIYKHTYTIPVYKTNDQLNHDETICKIDFSYLDSSSNPNTVIPRDTSLYFKNPSVMSSKGIYNSIVEIKSSGGKYSGNIVCPNTNGKFITFEEFKKQLPDFLSFYEDYK